MQHELAEQKMLAAALKEGRNETESYRVNVRRKLKFRIINDIL